jgi:hypothetical protein
MGEACSTHETDDTYMKNIAEKCEHRFADLGAGGKTVLK